MYPANLAQEVIDLQSSILKEGYYTNRWHGVLEHNKYAYMDVANKAIPDDTLIKILWDFWDALPDSPAIHGPIFHKLCDLMGE